MSKKIVIVGGGPAGYVAAIRAAQLGAEVDLVEKGALGGTCLNEGCIPTKVLLGIGAFYHQARTRSEAGVNSSAELDWQAALAHKDAVVAQLSGGVSWLLQNHGIRVHHGRAKILPGLQVQIGDDYLSGDAVILATGSSHGELSFPGSEREGIIYSPQALVLDEVPASILIIGGGAVGIEFATLYAHLGAEVTLVELMPELLPGADEDISGFLQQKLVAEGISVLTGSKLEGVEAGEAEAGGSIDVNPGTSLADGAGVSKNRTRLVATVVLGEGERKQIQADTILIATGRKPNTAGLGLEALGLVMDRAAVLVDEHMQTSIPGLYAPGDCNGKLMLAHAAMAQGITAVEHIMGVPMQQKSHIPACVYASPEIAMVGKTEQELKAAGTPYVIGRFSLRGNGKALIEGEDGLIKILADPQYHEVLGVHMIGPKVTEMIGEAVLCMSMEGTVEDMVNAVHAHPTVSESMWEAALSVLGLGIHG